MDKLELRERQQSIFVKRNTNSEDMARMTSQLKTSEFVTAEYEAVIEIN